LHSWQASVIFGRTSVAATMECLPGESFYWTPDWVAETGLEPVTQRL
jgi:hypothetical protein